MNLRTLQNGLVGLYVCICILCALISYRNYHHYTSYSSLPVRLTRASRKLDSFLTDNLRDELSSQDGTLVDQTVVASLPDHALSTLQYTLASDGSSRSFRWKSTSKEVKKKTFPYLQSLAECSSTELRFDVGYFDGVEKFCRSAYFQIANNENVPQPPIDLINLFNQSRYHHVYVQTLHYIIFPLVLPDESELLKPFLVDIATSVHLIVLPTKSVHTGTLSLDKMNTDDDPVDTVVRLSMTSLFNSLDLKLHPTDEGIYSYCRDLQSGLGTKVSKKLKQIVHSDEVGLFPVSMREGLNLLESVRRLEAHIDRYSSSEVTVKEIDAMIGTLTAIDRETGGFLNGGGADQSYGLNKTFSSEFQIGIHGPLLIPIILGILRVLLPKAKGCVNTRARKRDRIRTRMSRKDN
eukprot:GHVH01005024.1.p1 GENE.GHVH01005024.1~~GHVH01005024.1.p1  ORF type:complete len:407 (+),score=35.32 GHVH01005024.1:174-1394(+)